MAKFKLKVMVVDDEVEARQTLAQILTEEGYDVIQASTGQEVLARAKSEWPALIILDIVLPDIPGTEVFEKLRADPITKVIPVLMVTAKPSIVRQQIPNFSEKLDRYLEKPGRIDNLIRTVHEMLSGKK